VRELREVDVLRTVDIQKVGVEFGGVRGFGGQQAGDEDAEKATGVFTLISRTNAWNGEPSSPGAPGDYW
jgi:hypothetical protein